MPSRLVLPRPEYKKLTTQILQRDGFKCRLCKKRSSLHVHHVIFRSEQGDDASWNLLTCCGGLNSCHDAIHGLIPGYYIIILPKSGNPDDPIDCDLGISFMKYGKLRRRVKLKAKR
jgi:hypothetical protein